MTIKVEQDVLVVSLQERRPLQWPISNPSEDFLICKKQQTSPRDDKIVYDDEDASSIDTRSTASLSDADSYDFDRRVSFAEDIVTDEWTRPFTEEEDVSRLFYSNEETQRFRQEYRMERKLLHSLSPDLSHQDLSELISDAGSQQLERSNSISRVVVLHNDKLATFASEDHEDPSEINDFFDTPEFWSGSITWW